MMMLRCLVLLFIITILTGLAQISSAQTSSLDQDSPPNPLLDQISAAADSADMDVARNLNHPALVRGQIDRVRLGAVADVPAGKQIDSDELEYWETSFARGLIGAIALVGHKSDATAGAAPSHNHAEYAYEELWADWRQADLSQRAVISFVVDDADAAVRLFQQLQNNFRVLHFPPQSRAEGNNVDSQYAAKFYATATHRWLIDSNNARSYSGAIQEFNLLGSSMRGDSNSTLGRLNREQRRITASEPEVFRKATLGDEFEASTIPEIIVPGGIAFGETAVFEVNVATLHFVDNRLFVADRDGSRWPLPDEDIAILKACLDFAVRSERIGSDAVVDIDERGRVKLSAALRDTEAGYKMVVADTQPFRYIRYLPADKSIVIDNAVVFYQDNDINMRFRTDYEIRYLRADRQRIAQTRVALQYRYDDATDEADYLGDWGTDNSRLREDSDYAALGENTATAARYAAWVALFRSVIGHSLDFTDGRYEFMKTVTAGTPTPVRF
jgi:hypothetical protein